MKHMSSYTQQGKPTNPADALQESWETLRRVVVGMYATAHIVNIYVDDSHDEPHGHIHTILDADGTVLADARGEWWQAVNETIVIDEAAYDWFVDYSATNPDKEYPVGMIIAVPIGD